MHNAARRIKIRVTSHATARGTINKSTWLILAINKPSGPKAPPTTPISGEKVFRNVPCEALLKKINFAQRHDCTVSWANVRSAQYFNLRESILAKTQPMFITTKEIKTKAMNKRRVRGRSNFWHWWINSIVTGQIPCKSGCKIKSTMGAILTTEYHAKFPWMISTTVNEKQIECKLTNEHKAKCKGADWNFLNIVTSEKRCLNADGCCSWKISGSTIESFSNSMLCLAYFPPPFHFSSHGKQFFPGKEQISQHETA